VIDEAARVPEDLHRAVRPMLAVSGGRLICLSTPYGKRGFFYDAWANSGDDWARIEIPASRISRISSAFLAQERRAMGESWFRQEYHCSFEALEGLVYPDFARCVVPGPAPTSGKRVGGIDFGFRNPFAAIWGILDREGILWIRWSAHGLLPGQKSRAILSVHSNSNCGKKKKVFGLDNGQSEGSNPLLGCGRAELAGGRRS
jgi:hypothetical protein